MIPKLISKGIIKDLLIVAIGISIIWISLGIVFGTQNPFYVVVSESMVPELQVFDVLVVQGNTPFEEIKIGDIIVFNRPTGHDRVIVHRVASIIEDDPLTIRTKGDANPSSIPGTDFPITEKEYIGEVMYVVPQIGYITRVLQPPINYIIIAVIIGIMIAKQVIKQKKEKDGISEITDDKVDDPKDHEKTLDKLDKTLKDDKDISEDKASQDDSTDNKDISKDKASQDSTDNKDTSRDKDG